jgi:hypothetical protein
MHGGTARYTALTATFGKDPKSKIRNFEITTSHQAQLLTAHKQASHPAEQQKYALKVCHVCHTHEHKPQIASGQLTQRAKNPSSASIPPHAPLPLHLIKIKNNNILDCLRETIHNDC